MAYMAPPHHIIRPSTSSGSFRNVSNPNANFGPSTSLSSTSSKGFANQTITVDSALAQANGDSRAALEAVVAERNMLSGQNSQLWKLIEKQRAGHSSLLKELDRVRGERDKALGKQDGFGGSNALENGRSGPASSAKIRPSPSAPATATSVFGQARSFSVEEAGGPSRPRAPRQQSDQSHSTDLRAPSPLGFGSSHHFERSPASVGSAAELSHPNRSGSSSSLSSRPLEPRPNVHRQPSSSELAAKSISIDTGGAFSLPQLSLTQPQTSVTSSSTSTTSAIPLHTSPTSLPLDPPPTINHGLSPAPTTLQQKRESRIIFPDEVARYNAGTVDSPSPNTTPRVTQHATTTPSVPPFSSSSTIPRMGNGGSRSLSPNDDASSERSSTSRPQILGVSDADDSSSTSPAEDMYAESIISVSSKHSHDRPDSRRENDRDADAESLSSTRDTGRRHMTGGDTTTYLDHTPDQSLLSSPYQQEDSSGRTPMRSREPTGDSSLYSETISLNGDRDRPHPTVKIHGAVNDRSRPSTERSGSEGQQNDYLFAGTSGSSSSSPMGMSSSLSPSNTTSPQSVRNMPSPAAESSSSMQAASPLGSGSGTSSKSPMFKSTRLTINDLPYTKVKIHGSNIKTNDRGKEVLSFVYTVYPAGDGTPPPNANPIKKSSSAPINQPVSWQIEKLYSEILALDTAVRSKLGKAGSKRLAPLPDPKLFKDHAPAKVDQRKSMLETYMQTLVSMPLKDKNELCMFLSTDIVKGGAVLPADHKEGYLTKRGKNFGGWKTRYFVLNSPTLEYYESRGGQHLGSIQINGAQIGRQQKSNGGRESDDENSYRHAFLVIEAKRGPGGVAIRHVLCAESDEERDSWVALLVKYVVAGQGAAAKSHPMLRGLGDDEHRSSTSSAPASETSSWSSIPPGFSPTPSQYSAASSSATVVQPRSPADSPLRWGQNLSKLEDPPKHSMESFADSSSTSSSGGIPPTGPLIDAQLARRLLDRAGGHSPDVSGSSSLPSNHDEPLMSLDQDLNTPPRSGSELGQYPETWQDAKVGGSQSTNTSSTTLQQPLTARPQRASFHPAKSPSSASNSTQERSSSPEKPATADGRIKISGPMNGAPIPAGYKFGNDPPAHNNDRERKAKSGRFWGFGKSGAASGQVPRTVFGIPLETSLAVSQIADLPSVVFRCIEYLEAKQADQEEGIYRLSGSSTVIKNLKERFNNEGDVELLKDEDYWDPHAIAGLLKTFLRELPTSILTRELHMQFLGVIDLADQQERVQELAALISQLPFANYSLLRALTAHLILIVQNAPVNKMNMRNVGIVFSPTLGIPAGVFGLMLAEFEQVFNVNAAGVDESVKAEGQLVVDDVFINNRNSRSYADGEADTLLGLSGRRLGATEESDSDNDTSDILESSDTETEGASTPPATPDPSRDALLEDLPRHGTHSASVAAQRGLQVTVPPSNGRRASGLPASPRPMRMPFGNASNPVSPSVTITR